MNFLTKVGSINLRVYFFIVDNNDDSIINTLLDKIKLFIILGYLLYVKI